MATSEFELVVQEEKSHKLLLLMPLENIRNATTIKSTFSKSEKINQEKGSYTISTRALHVDARSV